MLMKHELLELRLPVGRCVIATVLPILELAPLVAAAQLGCVPAHKLLYFLDCLQAAIG